MSDSPFPSFAGGELPPRERAATRFTTCAVALIAIAATAAYLGWRTVYTVNWSAWWVALPLLALEFHAALSLILFVYATWDPTSALPVDQPMPEGKVAVLIPTYNEPVEILLPTVAAAVALEPAHETWVLDDGNRPEVESLAHLLGARYLARPTHEHAKAGNINHALNVIDADFVAVLDADHVALPGFLVHTLGYFADPRMAVVQTPQDFYNSESFEHERRRSWFQRRHTAQLYNEQELFYRVIQPGKNRWGGAFWCGTGAVVRVVALREVGGVAVETVTEDIHTTIRLHRRGWHTTYHNEVLARGLAAADADQYAAQRVRWGTGAMQVLRSENPLFVSGLTLRQRLSYAGTLLGWFDSWRSLGYLVIPPIVLATGAIPIRAHRNTFLLAFGGTLLIQRLALQRLGRGRAPAVLSTVFEFVRMEANLRATLMLFGRSGSARFRVTPKGRVGDERQRARVPVLLEAVLAVSLAAAVWFAASAAGLTPMHYDVPWAAYGAAFWLVVNCALVAAAAVRVRDRRFAAERRAAVRFDVDLDGLLCDVPVDVHDVSLTGSRVSVPSASAPAIGSAGTLALNLGTDFLELGAVVRSRRPVAGGEMLGLEFVAGQDDLRAQLALALFHTHAVPTLVPMPEGAAPVELEEASAA